MFRVSGANLHKITAYAYAHRRGHQPSGVYRGYAWGFFTLMRGYAATDPEFSAHDLNLGLLPDGSVLINGLQVHDVDGTSKESRSSAYLRAKKEVPFLVDYLRANVPGFAHAMLAEVAPELYIRETRHLRGLYTLTVKDIVTETHFWDRIGAASYPLDIHQYIQGERYGFGARRQPYTIPLRSLIAAVDGLLIASRAFSATYQAAASARVVSTTITIGEATGVAAAVAVRHGVTPHQLADRDDLVEDVQRRLVRAGAVIDF
jgi:hypothetical protein